MNETMTGLGIVVIVLALCIFVGFVSGANIGNDDGRESVLSNLDIGFPVIVIMIDRETENYIDQMARLVRYRDEEWEVIDEHDDGEDKSWIILKKKEVNNGSTKNHKNRTEVR